MSGSNRPPRASDPGPTYNLAAPAAAQSTPLSFPAHRGTEWPSLDDRLAEPETPEEFIRGERVFELGSLDPHADQHFRLDYVLGAHVKQGYIGASDLLTRASTQSDFASDTCIRQAGKNPKTGTRYLEEIAFEIVNEQSLRRVTMKAEDLSRRGVRRVFGIFVKSGEVKEWSRSAKKWQLLAADSSIEDSRCLQKPLPVHALLDAAKADRAVVTAILAKGDPELDNAVATALVQKQNPVLQQREAASKEDGLREGRNEGRKEGRREGRKEGRKEGEFAGKADAIITLLSARGIPISDAVHAQILACQDEATLNRWLVRAMQFSSAEEVIAE